MASTAGLRVGREVEVSVTDTPDHTLAAHLYSEDPGQMENLKGRARASLVARVTAIAGSRVAFEPDYFKRILKT